MKKNVLCIVCAGFWILISEFIRNEFLFSKLWQNHYQSLGLTFETLPINGVIWTLWSFSLAFIIFKLHQKFSFYETTAIAWTSGFVLMWFTIFNLQVLPLSLLIFAVPLSILEVIVAYMIIKKLSHTVS